MNENNETQKTFMDDVIKRGLVVSIFLSSGVRLIGKIKELDRYTIRLIGNNRSVNFQKHGLNDCFN